MSDFQAEMHQMRFSLSPDPAGGAYSTPPDLLAASNSDVLGYFYAILFGSSWREKGSIIPIKPPQLRAWNRLSGWLMPIITNENMSIIMNENMSTLPYTSLTTTDNLGSKNF